MRRHAGILCGLVFVVASARAAEQPDVVLQQAAQAVERGAFNEAVDRLELLSDQGAFHPDVSAARAYAYLERARSRSARPGDLGQTAAALEEALLSRPDDPEIQNALDKVREEIARRRARTGSSPLVQRPSPGRAVTSLVSENTWAALALGGSILLALGLFLRLSIRRRGAEITAAVALSLGLLALGLGASFTTLARHYRLTTRPAVVVGVDARLLDRDGRPIRSTKPEDSALPEGALVHVRERQGQLLEIDWGTLSGFVVAAQVRILRSP